MISDIFDLIKVILLFDIAGYFCVFKCSRYEQFFDSKI